MKTLTAVKKVEKAFNEKMNFNTSNNQYYLNGISFSDQDGEAICVKSCGGFCDTIKQALKRYGK